MTVTLEGDRVAPPFRPGAPWSGWGVRLWRLVVRLGATGVGVWARRHPSSTIGIGAFLLHAAMSLVRFARMAAGIDLAIFTQAAQQYAQGHLPWSYLKAAGGFDLLGDHFSPVVALLAPFYRLWPDARLLLVAQAALVGLAAGIAGPTDAPAVSAGSVETLAAGVTAAGAVTGDGSAWTTGLLVGTPQRTEPVTLVAGTAADLTETASATGAQVDHALRVVVGSADAPAASFLVAWSDLHESPVPTSPASGRVVDPSAVTLYLGDPGLHAGALPVASRVMAGVVPAWLPGAHVVFFTPGDLTDPSGKQVHAVEVPTLADPMGTGARVYLVVTDSQVPVGQRARGIFYVADDGTFIDADGTCADARQTPTCDGERPDGLDLKAELLSAIR